jgi:hypothetical protein
MPRGVPLLHRDCRHVWKYMMLGCNVLLGLGRISMIQIVNSRDKTKRPSTRQPGSVYAYELGHPTLTFSVIIKLPGTFHA